MKYFILLLAPFLFVSNLYSQNFNSIDGFIESQKSFVKEHVDDSFPPLGQ